MGLYDALGYGVRALHYEVGVVLPGPRPRRKLGGLGDFRDLRKYTLLGEVSR